MRRHEWRPGRVISVEPAAEQMIALRVRPDEWLPHLAGQHYEIRFPGEPLSRKFSIVSSPHGRESLEFGVQVLARGMLSPRLAESTSGTRLELRGPTGAAFAWSPEDRGPLVLIGGGAGITPLISIRDHHEASGAPDPLLFLLSARTPRRVYHLDRYANGMITRFTADQPRFDRAFLHDALAPVLDNPATRARVCGPGRFMNTMVDLLLDLGIAPDRIRSEAFV